jgi:hypothetical protein
MEIRPAKLNQTAYENLNLFTFISNAFLLTPANQDPCDENHDPPYHNLKYRFWQ